MKRQERRAELHASAPKHEVTSEGDSCYLGFLPGAHSIRYSSLIEALPGLLKLLQAAHRLGQASMMSSLSHPTSMNQIALERSREARCRLEVERSADIFATALEAVCQRMGERSVLES